jgi:mannose-6-phosphate isomerase-like protein (cupin superfamily)
VSVRVTAITDVEPVAGVDDFAWRPVRHRLGITGFGTNAYSAASAGDLVVEDHSEEEFEELYVVVAGAACFEVDGETFDAPAGTLVFVTPPSQRVAHALEPETTVLAVGAVPGRAFEVSGWEKRWLAGAGEQ